MQAGIIGLPNVGKSTLFNILTRAGAETANYPFTTIDRNVGIAVVPDQRLEKIALLVKPKKVTPATIKFTDIAGLVKGASQGEGLGNQFLGYIREADLLVHVVRAFNGSNIAHISSKVNPVGDAEVVEYELIMADLQTVENRLQKIVGKARSKDKLAVKQQLKLEKVKSGLQAGKPASLIKEIEELPDLNLLSGKPMLYVINVSEADLKEPGIAVREMRQFANSLNRSCLVISAKLEEEISEISEDEAEVYRQELGVEESSLDKLIEASYRQLGLISFFTANQNECRSWAIPKGTTAVQAAAKVHTDMARGFIKAEVAKYPDLVKHGSMSVLRDKGLLSLEGRDYLVEDGDLINFKFSV
jgi:hypothetical protein